MTTQELEKLKKKKKVNIDLINHSLNYITYNSFINKPKLHLTEEEFKAIKKEVNNANNVNLQK